MLRRDRLKWSLSLNSSVKRTPRIITVMRRTYVWRGWRRTMDIYMTGAIFEDLRTHTIYTLFRKRTVAWTVSLSSLLSAIGSQRMTAMKAVMEYSGYIPSASYRITTDFVGAYLLLPFAHDLHSKCIIYADCRVFYRRDNITRQSVGYAMVIFCRFKVIYQLMVVLCIGLHWSCLPHVLLQVLGFLSFEIALCRPFSPNDAE